MFDLKKNHKIKIQIYTRILPGDNFTGAKVYLLSLLEFLSKAGFEIELIAIGSSPGGRSPVYKITSKINEYCSLYVRGNIIIKIFLFRFVDLSDFFFTPLAILFYLIPEFLRQPLILKFDSFFKKNKVFISKQSKFLKKITKFDQILYQKEIKFVKKSLNRFRPDVVIANYVWLADIFDLIPKERKILKVLLAHEVIHKRIESALKNKIKMNYSDWNKERETNLLNKSDIIIAIQSEDADEFTKMTSGNHNRVITVPLAVQLRLSSINQVSGRCLFVGSGGGKTNIHGLNWFLKNVWPIVLKSNPETHLHVCGSVCDEVYDKFHNVILKGRVKDLKSEYNCAEVCIAPLLFGSGLKIKIIEAMSYGRIIVTTTTGAQGLKDIIDKSIIVEDSPEVFAKAILNILKNKEMRKNLEKHAIDYVKKKLSPETVYMPLIKEINEALNTKSDNVN